MNENYVKWKNNPNLEDYLKREIDQMNQEQIDSAFGGELTFGTAGLRGLLGAGTNRLNIYTVRKATLGLANYLRDKYPGEISVCICHDSRHFSKEFTLDCAATLSAKGIKVYLYDDVMPTPLLSYFVRKTNSQAGIMITASHNPKEYNGYKVYNQTGCQLNIDEAKEVYQYISEIKDEFEFKPEQDDTKIVYLDDSYLQSYLDELKPLMLTKNSSHPVKVVFTPEHGTSYKVMPRCFNQYGFNDIICVEEQMQPDGDFPNTKSSNPEEISAYELAIEYAQKNQADIILANDPDADRLGIMVRDNSGEYVALSGNQTASLIIDFLVNQKDVGGKKLYKTIVTGEMGAKIAKAHQVEVIELLTGFKFIGEQINQLSNEEDFLIGYEESYGYLIHPLVRDKDAIQSALVITQMVGYYKQMGKTLLDRLDELYKEYGYFEEVTYSLSYPNAQGMQIISQAMEQARNANLEEIAGFEVSKKVDYQNGIDNLPPADVVKFYLEDKGWVVLRPSGTEPKLKIYISICTDSLAESQKVNKEIYNQVREIFGLN